MLHKQQDMIETITIPTELYDDLVKVVNRLQACSNRSSAIIGAAETSLKGGKDTPNLPSKKVILENITKKYVENTLKKIQL